MAGCVFFVNDGQESFGGEDKIRDFLLAQFPDLRWAEIRSSKRTIWSIDEVGRLITRVSRECNLQAVVVSDKVGREIVAKLASITISRNTPLVVLGNDISVQTVWIDPQGELNKRDSLTGEPFFDIDVDELQFKYPVTKRVMADQRSLGRIYTLGDLVRVGKKAFAKIPGIGPRVITDVAETLKRQIGLNWQD